MAVVIEELEVQAQREPSSPPAPPSGEGRDGNEVDERALHAALSREAWRLERLAAD
ncbi:MAG TPA: hypothetical protein VFM98_08505 [Ramlibacter sp.]|uniref:hypothetical protein n=1 Tax=Ramlibacter sp. TaxID=1917967 RepID=UPI002D7F2186|nr:hypothetical protein [Ramlibacter sp.]HET8745632.1 hypothetical protein [Ramlibacter sp.]